MSAMITLLAAFADSSFARLFTEMNSWAILLFVLGLVFCMIEMFVPGFGFFGVGGIVLVVAGIVVRMINGGDLAMLVYMVAIALVLFILMFWLLSRLITKSRLSRSALFHVDSAVSTGRTEATADFSSYIGKTGVAMTLLRPIGRARIDGDVVDVVARDSFIPEGATVKVIAAEGQRVVVIEIEEDPIK